MKKLYSFCLLLCTALCFNSCDPHRGFDFDKAIECSIDNYDHLTKDDADNPDDVKRICFKLLNESFGINMGVCIYTDELTSKDESGEMRLPNGKYTITSFDYFEALKNTDFTDTELCKKLNRYSTVSNYHTYNIATNLPQHQIYDLLSGVVTISGSHKKSIITVSGILVDSTEVNCYYRGRIPLK